MPWIQFPRREGQTSRQAHADLPANTFEREMGKEGFNGPASHCYHRHPPTNWTSIDGPLRPQAFDTQKLIGEQPSPWDATSLLFNDRIQIRWWRFPGSMDHLVRNADGDELLFIHKGAGDLFCDFGHLTFSDGDYLLLPRGVMWRLQSSQPIDALLIEATGDSYRLPDKGIVGAHAIFDPAVLEAPTLDDVFLNQQSEVDWELRVKRRGKISRIRYPFNPLDIVGWHGNLTAVKLNWRDIRPLMSHRYHVPPSSHTTFQSSRFVVCTFVPRPIETDPGALKVPFFHNNDDYEEVIFYHAGEFFSRDNIHPGMITLHPSGITHGPHPNAFAVGAASRRVETDEVAVMIDVRDELEVADGCGDIEWKEYVNSWSTVD